MLGLVQTVLFVSLAIMFYLNLKSSGESSRQDFCFKNVDQFSPAFTKFVVFGIKFFFEGAMNVVGFFFLPTVYERYF